MKKEENQTEIYDVKKVIYTESAPNPIGPYSQAILINKVLYTSGQIPLDPVSMELSKGTIEEQTSLVMSNLQAILREAKMTFDNVIKTTIYLDDMDNFESVNKIYSKYFNSNSAPVRETVAVKTLPMNASLEISVVAIFFDPDRTLTKFQ